MKFELDAFYRRIPDSKLIDDVIAVSKKISKDTLTADEYSRHGQFNARTLTKRFGSWYTVIAKAGLKTARAAPTKTSGLNEELLFKNLANVWIALGRQPRLRDMLCPPSCYPGTIYIRYFGSWMAALRNLVEHENANGNSYQLEETKLAAPAETAIGEKKNCRKIDRDTRQVSFRLKMSVFIRDAFRCTACRRGPSTHPGTVLHCDHIIPWSKGGSKGLLWEEYKKKHPDGAGRSAFLFHFSQWKARKIPIMRQNHKAGDKLFIDFAGERLNVTDKETNKIKQVEVFVAVLGASQFTYVEAVMTQRKEDFIAACENALHFFGGVPAAIVPDNLRSAVTKSDKYEPTINETFADFAEHYNTTILPARAYRPTDKAVVENTVKIVYTRIYARLRNEVFYSIESLNNAILTALEEHNNQILTGKDYSRRQQYEQVEKSALLPLSAMRYEFKKQLYATVAKNGHVALSPDKHYYSVPFGCIGKRVKVLFTSYNVEVFDNYERVALHKRVQSPFKYTTDKEHLPPAHRFVAELQPEKLLVTADEIHKDVKLYITKILDAKKHPEHLYKICMGVLNLSKKYGNERLTKACQRSLVFGIYNYRIVKKILESGLDIHESEDVNEEIEMPQHDNIRGNNYYE